MDLQWARWAIMKRKVGKSNLAVFAPNFKHRACMVGWEIWKPHPEMAWKISVSSKKPEWSRSALKKACCISVRNLWRMQYSLMSDSISKVHKTRRTNGAGVILVEDLDELLSDRNANRSSVELDSSQFFAGNVARLMKIKHCLKAPTYSILIYRGKPLLANLKFLRSQLLVI